jgi:hypothetical protein
MLNNFVKEISTKLELNVLWKLGQAFDIIEKPFMNGIFTCDFMIFRLKVGEILFLKWSFLLLKINFEFWIFFFELSYILKVKFTFG